MAEEKKQKSGVSSYTLVLLVLMAAVAGYWAWNNSKDAPKAPPPPMGPADQAQDQASDPTPTKIGRAHV